MRRLTTAQFIARAQVVHGVGTYNYSQTVYARDRDRVKILCLEHGPFEQIPSSHLQGRGCLVCGNKRISTRLSNTTQDFIEKARVVHGLTYDYSQVDYISNNQKVVVVCQKHGAFKQKPNHHLSQGSGCPICAHEQRMETARRSWIALAKGRVGILYFLKVFNALELFYKVGVTYSSVKSRYARKKALNGYSYEILVQHTSTNAARIYDWEQSILETFAHLRYHPKQSFGGVSECFSEADPILAIFPL